MLRIARCPALLACLLLWGCSPSRTDGTGDAADSLPFTNSALVTDPDSLVGGLEDFQDGDRENWQKPQIVISYLGDLSDKVVADIGAGTGYFTMPLARKAQKVIAIDIDQHFLDYIDRHLKRMPDREVLNVDTRLTSPDDPSLQEGEVDVVLMVNTYTYIDNRVDYFRKVHKGMRPEGRVVVVDFKREPLPVGPGTEDKMNPAQVIAELDSAGFAHLRTDTESLEYQYIVTAVRK